MDPLTGNFYKAVAFEPIDFVFILVVLVLILFSAFFSSSETAFSTMNSVRMKNLAEEKCKGARRALFISENYQKALVTILVGNNLVNIASTTICAVLFTKFIFDPTLSNILNTVVMTIVILTFGEILPKALAKNNPEKYAMRYSNILYFIMIILTPVVFLFYRMQNGLLKKVKNEDVPTVTEDELESIIDTMEEEGVIDENNAEWIQGAIKLGDATAYDVMTPRVDMVSASIDDKIEDIIQLFYKYQYSRMPIYENNRDNIIGILNQKDFFTTLLQKRSLELKKLLSKPLFVPENIKVDDLIRLMQKHKIHIAIVLDEHSGTSGIATMEDCLECVVGEIYDEHDKMQEEPQIKKIDENTYILDAEVEIQDLFDKLQIEHPPKTEYPTLSGFLFEMSEDLVKLNDELKFTTIDDIVDRSGNMTSKVIDMIFNIVEMDGNRIKKIKLTINSKTVEE